ncbi:MAG: sigma-70 family RNA polymerase sigma factor [Rhodospirillales bacterium]|nr:sigma-70 family RNA polymerase sigma factor [Rhodospirillales bacterium]
MAGFDLVALVGGDKVAWDGFVRAHARLILAAARSLARDEAEAEDLAQDVFVRLCKDDFRLLKTYDPARASLSTWLTIVARSTARDALRRKRAPQLTLEDAPEPALAVDPVEPAEKLAIPEGLLSPRQKEVLDMLYERDMDVAEIAASLGVDPQTVRSMHHKALVKLRAHFGPERG